MWMMSNNQVRSVLNEPSRILLLRVGWPILQFVAPMNRDHDKIRLLSRQPQLLRQLNGRDLLHAPIGCLNGCDCNKTDGQLAEAKKLR